MKKVIEEPNLEIFKETVKQSILENFNFFVLLLCSPKLIQIPLC